MGCYGGVHRPFPSFEEEPCTQTSRTPAFTSPSPPTIDIPTHDDIAQRAFVIYEQRGAANGSDLDDWLEAERQLLLDRIRAVDPYQRIRSGRQKRS
jgi:hypothetical protein